MVSRLSAESEGECLQCGGRLGPAAREIVVRSTSTGELALLHLDCLDQWQRKPWR